MDAYKEAIRITNKTIIHSGRTSKVDWALVEREREVIRAELARLREENVALRDESDQLMRDCKGLDAEIDRLKVELEDAVSDQEYASNSAYILECHITRTCPIGGWTYDCIAEIAALKEERE